MESTFLTISARSVRQPHEVAAQPDSTLNTSPAPRLQSVVANTPPINDVPLDTPRANGDRELARNFAQGLRQVTGTQGTDGAVMQPSSDQACTCREHPAGAILTGQKFPLRRVFVGA